jgi:hypothetical protein
MHADTPAARLLLAVAAVAITVALLVATAGSAAAQAMPQAPGNVQVSNISATGVTVTWTSIPNAAWYEVVIGEQTGSPIYPYPTATGTSYTATSLNPGFAYKVVVRGRNATHQSPNSAQKTWDTPFLTPVVSTVDDVCCNEAWAAIQDPQTDENGIDLEIAAGTSGPWTAVDSSVSLDKQITGLSGSTTYYLRTRTKTRYHTSAWSALKTFTTPAPSAVFHVRSVSRSPNQDFIRGETINGSIAIKNTGLTAGSCTYKFVLSSDTTFDANDTVLYTGTTTVTAVNAQYVSGYVSMTIPMSIALGTYHFGAYISSGSVSRHTLSGTPSVKVTTEAEIEADSITAMSQTVGPYHFVSFNIILKNVGGRYGSVTATVYLSTDTTLDAGDPLLKAYINRDASGGATRSFSLSDRLPMTIAAGSYHLIVKVTGSTASTSKPTAVTATAAITVLPNTAPTTTGLANISIQEDGADQTRDLFAAFDDTQDADASLRFEFDLTSGTNFSHSYNQTSGILTLSPRANQFGTGTIKVTCFDTSNASVTATITYTITSVPDAPAAQSVGPFSYAPNAQPVSLSMATWFYDPDDTPLTYAVHSNSHPAVITPSISGNTLTLTFGANQYGLVTLVIRATDAVSLYGDNTITVAVNTAPQCVGSIPNQTLPEGGSPVTFNLYPLFDDAEDADSAMTYTVINGAGSAAGPSISGGTLTLTPSANDTGTAWVRIKATDTCNAYATLSFNVTVTATNDPPVITCASTVTVDEDEAYAAAFATFSPGPADESSQSVTVSIGAASDPAAFAVQPTISQAGYFEFTPAADTFGTYTVDITAKDNGGTANGGSDTTVKTVTIIVEPVNDAPALTANLFPSVAEDAGAQVWPAWATVDAGPGESSQTVTASVTSVTTPAMFAVAPALTPAGDLTFTTAPDAAGAATFVIEVTDDGGTANGGTDTTTATVRLYIEPVNDAPVITAPAAIAVYENRPAALTVPAPIEVSDVDAADAPIELELWIPSGQGALHLDLGTSLVITAGSNDSESMRLRGTIGEFNSRLPSLTYRPPLGFIGTTPLSVRVSDRGNSGSGGPQIAQTTVSLDVEGTPQVEWRNSAGAPLVLAYNLRTVPNRTFRVTMQVANLGTPNLTLGPQGIGITSVSPGAQARVVTQAQQVIAGGDVSWLVLEITPGAGTGSLTLHCDGNDPLAKDLALYFMPTAAPRMAVERDGRLLWPGDDLPVPAVAVGDPVVVPLAVSNTGDAPLQLNATALPTPTAGVQIAGAAQFVAPGETVDVTVTVTPTAAGGFSAGVSLATNDAWMPTTELRIIGTAIADAAPRVALRWGAVAAVPGRPLDLGHVAAGNDLAATLTLTNEGLGALKCGAIALLPDLGTTANVTPATLNLAPGASADITVTLGGAPTSGVLRAELTLGASDPHADGCCYVLEARPAAQPVDELTATVVTPGPLALSVPDGPAGIVPGVRSPWVSPRMVAGDLRVVPLGGGPRVVRVELRNTGTTPVQFTDVVTVAESVGLLAEPAETPTGTLAPGAAAEVAVCVADVSAAGGSWEVVIPHDADPGYALRLSGAHSAGLLAICDAVDMRPLHAVGLGSARPEATVSRELLLVNVGNMPLTVTQLSAGTQHNAVVAHSAAAGAQTLQPGESLPVTATITVGALEGAFSGELVIATSNADQAEIRFPIQGTARAAAAGGGGGCTVGGRTGPPGGGILALLLLALTAALTAAGRRRLG